jgi:MoaA/NifB/PqqE/SkfB family radical SAM enzyme
MYTNASLFDKRLSEEIIFAGLDEMFISFDAAEKETYEAIRKGLDFDRVSKGIETFLEVRATAGQKKPKVHFAYTCMDLNRQEIHKFKSRWKDRVDSIGIFDVCDWADQKRVDSEIYRFKKKWPCAYLWKTMFILWNGDVSICCLDFNGKVTFGNAVKESIIKIWKNEPFRRARELHLGANFNHIPLCAQCTLNRWWFQYEE